MVEVETSLSARKLANELGSKGSGSVLLDDAADADIVDACVRSDNRLTKNDLTRLESRTEGGMSNNRRTNKSRSC